MKPFALVPILVALSLVAAIAGCKDSPAEKKPATEKEKKEADEAKPSGPSEAELNKAKEEFKAYQNKAKTTEALDMLDKLNKGASAYFSTPRFSPLGEKIPCQFPASIPATPSIKGCADGAVDKDGDGRCDVVPGVWDDPTWNALSFELREPHYFVYQFDSQGFGAEATFFATAFGDLDKDGVLSTFQRTGKGTVQAGDYCEAELNSSMYVENELE